MAIHEMEYRGLNLMDEVCTVELAIDEESETIHIWDTNHVVEPTYHFTKKQYELSEGFFQLVDILKQKYYFSAYKTFERDDWIEKITWIFYSSHQTVKYYGGKKLHVYPLSEIPPSLPVYPKYLQRLQYY